MRFGPHLAVLVVAFSLVVAPARAGEKCPAKSLQLDDIVVALKESPSCDRAMEIFTACEFGTSGDVELGEVVQKKCEGDFVGRIKAWEKRAYKAQLTACDFKYRNRSGTMYRSFEAFCRAKAAQDYARRALNSASPSRAR